MYGESLPDLPPSETLHEQWQNLGYSANGLNGPEPFTWSELLAFKTLAGQDLENIELQTLMDMSRAYCVERHNDSPMRIAPMERKQ